MPRLLVCALVAGSVLCFPRIATADGNVWTVRAGDALSVLADRFGCSVDQLREWNDLDDDRIFVGQTLRIEDAPQPQATYAIEAGDTLSELAVRFDVTLEELLRWNPDLDPDRIREGQVVRLGPERFRIAHRVVRGDNLATIAQRYRVTVHQVREWNPPLRRNQYLRLGQTLVVYSEIPESTSASVGWAYLGRLELGVPLTLHPGYFIREPSRAYGTHETVRFIAEAFDVVRRAHPQAPRVRVHDISDRNGGYLAGHRSHQSGRDADISLFHRAACPADGCGFRNLTPDALDAETQWTLLEAWLERDLVEAIFVDYALQEPLYEVARRRGATREQLHRWFQFPRGRGFPLGIIRHYRQHRDHVHVRFRCHESDVDCH